MPHPLFTPRPETRRIAVEEVRDDQRLNAWQLDRYGVLDIEGEATIGPFVFRGGRLKTLGVRHVDSQSWCTLDLNWVSHTTHDRVYFQCEHCDRHCRDVYDVQYDAQWKCRRCAGLTYLSRRNSRRSHRTLARDPVRQWQVAAAMERGGHVRPWEAAALAWLEDHKSRHSAEAQRQRRAAYRRRWQAEANE